MKKYRIAVIPGDGIGKEVMRSAIEVLEASGVPVEFTEYEAGDEILKSRGVALPEETIEGARNSDAVLFGAAGESAADVIVRLRRELGTFANIRPAKSFEGVRCLYPDVDIVIIRENTEDLYKMLENEVREDTIVSLRVTTKEATERICRFAFEYARNNGRRRVSLIHKANVLKKSDGMMKKIFYEISQEYPEIEADDYYVDAASMFMVMNPKRFDVMVTSNMFGDILSDLASGLVGGLGMSPSANIGERNALFEPVHGSAPDIAGKGIANPSAMILSAVMMLEYLGEIEEARRIERALRETIKEGKVTPDLGGDLGTEEMTREIIKRL
ncbi:MAG: NAD-dependent isocitrate dehydrogenase [Archaeoglobi archaeon]|nr:NAD-dependent isocitrate dehydrogenase [Candidatus Mnemosynella sp.]